MRLLRLQSDFSDGLRSQGSSALPLVLGSGFEIYRNNYRSQLQRVLADTFKHLQLWLGEDAFRRAADTHIHRSSPASWTLDAYGHDFPDTLEKLHPADREVVELAWLDLAMAQAFVAADAEPLKADNVADVHWEQARIRFVPSLRLAEARSNAADIWAALESEVMPPVASELPKVAGFVVWRISLAPRFRLVDALEHRAMQWLCSGATFGAVCARIEAEIGPSRAVEAAGQMLASWLASDLIARIGE